MKLSIIAVALSILGIANANAIDAESNNDHLGYVIPANAVKRGPFRERGGETSYQYLIPQDNTFMAYEYFDRKTDKKIKLSLYKLDYYPAEPGKEPQNKSIIKHGVQMEWHLNGVKKSEEPYNNGIMDGIFKYWDEKGNLVGYYRITKGTGTKKIYFSNGRLLELKDYENNLVNGRMFMFYDNGQAESLNWKIKDKFYTDSFAFYKNGKIYCLGLFDNNNDLHGVGYYYDKNGNWDEKKEKFHIHGKELTKDEYIKAIANDSTLPPYDPEKIKEYAREKTSAIVEQYKNMEPVRIPLDEKLAENDTK